MSKYKWLFFDADNTIFDFDKSEATAFEKAIEAQGILYQSEMLDLYKKINHQCWRDLEDGKITKAELKYLRFELFFSQIEKNANIPQFSRDYLSFLSQTNFLLDNAIHLLETVRKDHQLVLVTNGLKEVQRPRFARSQIGKYFETIVISDEIGHAKPHAAFFDFTFEQINHPAKEEVLMIGDNINADIGGAQNYGLDTCWYNHRREQKKQEIVPTFTIDNIKELISILYP